MGTWLKLTFVPILPPSGTSEIGQGRVKAAGPRRMSLGLRFKGSQLLSTSPVNSANKGPKLQASFPKDAESVRVKG